MTNTIKVLAAVLVFLKRHGQYWHIVCDGAQTRLNPQQCPRRMEWSVCPEERLPLEGPLHSLESHQRLPHDGLESDEKQWIHDEGKNEIPSDVALKAEGGRRETGARTFQRES